MGARLSTIEPIPQVETLGDLVKRRVYQVIQDYRDGVLPADTPEELIKETALQAVNDWWDAVKSGQNGQNSNGTLGQLFQRQLRYSNNRR